MIADQETPSVRARRRLGVRVERLEPWLYLVFVGIGTLVAAHGFFNARQIHLAWAEAARTALDPSVPARQLEPIWWSAPLDDTFIHFDFARSWARLRPFEWADGGGYSSGATSWLYPMLLAIAEACGCHGQSLGTAADVLAMGSVFGLLWATRSLFRGLSRWVSYLLAPLILTSGVLGWSLWNGMELGLFFGIWGLTAHYYSEYRQAKSDAERTHARRGMAFSGLGLVMTRPEALLAVGLFAIFACASCERAERWRVIWRISLPAVALTTLRALVNWAWTGSLADAGAIVKLITLRPFLEPREMALKWASNVGFQFTRITTYHTTDDSQWGWQIWVLLLLAWLPRRTRSTVALLSLQALGWLLLVAQNEYVRYQNDRYTMPSVLFMLVAVALGLGAAIDGVQAAFGTTQWRPRLALGACFALVAGSFVAHQSPRLNQQRWLFGRASRNIAEQQIRVGQLFEAGQYGESRRVLVGDAGAIPYFSDVAGLDAIGLGGTDGLPFAQAVNLGVGATVELIERMPAERRPDRLAIYPSWWELLPVWFGHKLDEVTIKGNIICGAPNKVIYAADWRSLENESRPTSLGPSERVIDELDFADIVSETAHGCTISSKHSGYVVMKVLPHPRDPSRELFDAGRLVFSNARARFHLRGLSRGQPATLVFRAAPNFPMAFHVTLDGREQGLVELDGAEGWQEPRIELDPKRLRDGVTVDLTAETAEFILYHVWAVSP